MSSKSSITTTTIQKLWQNCLPWLEAVALTTWGIALLRLWLLGKLYLLIHPNYIPLTIIAAFLLTIVGILEAWRVWQRQRSTSKSKNQTHIALIKPSLSSSLLLIVAIIAICINPRPFTSEKAIHRGVFESIADARTVPQSFRASNRPEDRTLVEWVRTISAYPEPDAYKGQKADMTGFVVHAPDRPDNIFILTRFIITCCAADVYPVGLPIKIEGSRSQYAPDKWVRIEGQADVDSSSDKRQVVIVASKVTEIPEPKNPYDY
ncbi:MAG: TIGR03943 family protein [Pseudanabaenaceae cyanobacterium bins.39]|nr:TIGR03943 family protein [Pseudanabaenaceae cyanobacterium bins.39]